MASPDIPSNKNSDDSSKANSANSSSSKSNNFRDKVLQAGVVAASAEGGPQAGALVNSAMNAREAQQRENLLRKQQKLQDQELKNARQGMKKSSGAEDAGWKIFLVVLGVVSLFAEMASNGQMNTLIILIFIFILIFYLWGVAHFRIKDTGFIELVVAIAASLLLPMVISYLQSSISDQIFKTLSGLFYLLQPVTLYLIFKFSDDNIKPITLMRGAYLIILIFLSVSYLMSAPFVKDELHASQATIANPLSSFKVLGQSLGKSWSGTWKGVVISWDQMISSATGQPCSACNGQQENERGIFLSDAAPDEKVYYTSSQIHVSAKIRAQNLPKQINVRTSCYIEDNSAKGTSLPQSLTLTQNDINQIDCQFNSLPAGLYTVHVVASFDYETDANIVYYFVDSKTSSSLYANLKIPQTAKAIYTGGPALLGLPELSLPLRVSNDSKTTGQGNYPFGAKLVNSWTGNIIRGLSYDLDVPQSVQLVSCSRNPITDQGEGGANDRKIYRFEINNTNLKETFDSVSCRMNIDEPGIMGQDIVSQKTFAAKAIYEYSVDTTAILTVSKDFTN